MRDGSELKYNPESQRFHLKHPQGFTSLVHHAVAGYLRVKDVVRRVESNTPVASYVLTDAWKESNP